MTTAVERETVLDVRDLVKHFPVRQGALRRTVGLLKAVDGVSLELRRGETLGIVGESGCGKSTLAKLLTAHERPTSGRVTVLGRSLHDLRGGELRRARRHVQLIFQDPYTSLDPRMTVAATVREPYDVNPDLAPRGDRDRLVRELLEAVGLNPDHGGRYPHELSGGQRQRVGIARALALRPEVLVCDEPVSALDVSVQAQIVNLLEELRERFSLAYVFIAHDLSVVRHLADRVAVMYLGKVVETGSEAEVYESAAHPYTRALLSAAPVPDPAARGTRQEIVLDGEPPSPVDPPSGCSFHPRCFMAEDGCARSAPVLEPVAGAGHLVSCHLARHPGGDGP
ncbi:peptide/nickel transport system ATP-binding protein/oligopeptide transport system ATP-binding protein [Nonomuraea fuscirosea]|uniref:Peptide/nickel transport system ATP-binding protein/oligopeptide transport system ATP-binding protein n=1 Tax=Nonomuraea fuscirosea TaxID=1291556 RepID=A0A2T0MTD3_9ACTN|nr:oligopeptide/dipeptide ABC transporter ATP-binding protein [Nonomuraea fuscirosea]PRX61858.1 peptide/nickel transport system ATP-binding protein/oligopeptide transport system ATP-binding protein [Nonomuraea fuscirosea]